MLVDVEEARLIPKIPRSSAKPNQRPGRIPASTMVLPSARFQGRGRRKAPEGFPKPTFRSAKRLSTRRRRTTSSPLARFQGRRRRKAPGYSPERFRSREAARTSEGENPGPSDGKSSPYGLVHATTLLTSGSSSDSVLKLRVLGDIGDSSLGDED